MVETLAQPFWEHKQVSTLLRRGWPAIVAGVLVGLLLGALATALAKPQYTAAASVIVAPTGASNTTQLANSRTTGTVNLDTESNLVKSTAVAEQVHSADLSTRSTSITLLLSAVTVTVPANTEILTIKYVADSAATAAQRANDFASAYLTRRLADAQATLQAQINKTDTDLTALTAQLKSVAQSLGSMPQKSAQKNFVQAQRALLISQITELSAQRTALSTTVITPGQILTEATTPAAASSPSRILNLTAGLAGGLLLGLLVAWLRFAVRKQLRRADDVQRELRLPVLAVVPASGGRNIVAKDTAAFQSYRRVANALTTNLSGPGVVLITGQCSLRAATAVVANIASVIGSSGVPVRLTSAEVGDMADAWDALLEMRPELAEAVVPIPVGKRLTRQGLDDVRQGGFLIVLAPDPENSADAQTLSVLSDAVILVVEARARANHALVVLGQLDAVGAPLLGTVLVPAARWWRHTTRGNKKKRNNGESGPATVVPSKITATGNDERSAPPRPGPAKPARLSS